MCIGVGSMGSISETRDFFDKSFFYVECVCREYKINTIFLVWLNRFGNREKNSIIFLYTFVKRPLYVLSPATMPHFV